MDLFLVRILDAKLLQDQFLLRGATNYLNRFTIKLTKK